jgi:hypothetical protein
MDLQSRRGRALKLHVGTISAPSKRGVSRVEAAAYIGVSPCKFDEMVADHRMPAPKRINGRKVWDIRDLDLAFDALPYENGPVSKTTWDDLRQS